MLLTVHVGPLFVFVKIRMCLPVLCALAEGGLRSGTTRPLGISVPRRLPASGIPSNQSAQTVLRPRSEVKSPFTGHHTTHHKTPTFWIQTPLEMNAYRKGVAQFRYLNALRNPYGPTWSPSFMLAQ